MIIEFFNWKLTLTLGDVKTVRFQIQPSICIQDSIEKLPPIFLFPFATQPAEISPSIDGGFRGGIEHEIALNSASIRRQNGEYKWILACCLHTDSQFINKKKEPS
jgi:hypothetical protein